MRKIIIWSIVFLLVSVVVSANPSVIEGKRSFKQIGNLADDETNMTDSNTLTTAQHSSTVADELNGTYDAIGNDTLSSRATGLAIRYFDDANSALKKLVLFGSNNNFTTRTLIFNESTFFNYPDASNGVRNVTFQESEQFRFYNVIMQTDGSGVGGETAQDWYVYGVIQAVVGPGFTINASDRYDGTIINNFTVTLFNSTISFVNTTTTGSVRYGNITQGIYDVNITNVTDSGGYFNNSFFDLNASLNLNARVFQSVVLLKALDGLDNSTILNFTAVTNQSTNSTGNGELLILIKAGHFSLNLTSEGFEKLVTNFSIIALANNSLNVTMGSVFTFQLIREVTNLPFQTNLTNLTTLNVFCPNETIVINFTGTNNISQIINCPFTLMQIVVDYGALGSYFRTLIPDFSEKTIRFYLIDLVQGDTAIQRIIKLIDLTQTFTNSILTVNRAIGTEIVDIINQRFDISDEVNLFLVKDSLYTIKVNNDVEEIVLGNLIPTEAGTQTIILPSLIFVPQEIVLGGNISWAYTFNSSTGLLKVDYVDQTEATTLVRFTVTNESSGGNQVFQGESLNNPTVTISFNQAFGNITWGTELFFQHPTLGNVTEKRTWFQLTEGSAIDLKGFDAIDQTAIKKWAAWIFLVVWLMLFTPIHAGIGLVSLMGWLWVFIELGWIQEVSTLVFGFVALMAIVSWMLESMRKA